MPSSLLVAGLDARSLLLEAPLLRRDRHVVGERSYARDLLQDILPTGTSLVVLGPELPDLTLVDAVRRIRASPATRQVSILAVVPASAPADLEQSVLQAGANAALRRPLDPFALDTWLGKLLAVPHRVVARIPVQGQVVGTSKGSSAAHFCGLTQNLSVGGMLLASPMRLAEHPDLDLEFILPGVAGRLRALGRVVRDAPEVAWPYVGYGVEFLFVPPESQEAITLLVAGALAGEELLPEEDSRHGIHSTVRRQDWIYEIRQPVPSEVGWQAEIRRSPRADWRPGAAGPFFVVAGPSVDLALTEAKAFVDRLE